MGSPEVSIVIPVFNEEESLPRLVEEIQSVMSDAPWAWELLFVDDGSTDGSRQRLIELAGAEEHIRIAALAANKGQSCALAAGFRLCRGELVITLDADLQNDPADIPLLLASLENLAAVSGVRQRRQDTWIRRCSSRIANGVRRAVLHDDITDVGCSLKAYRIEYLRKVPVFNGFHRFLPALVQMAGGEVGEVEVGHRARVFGASKYGVHNRLWRGIADLLAVHWMGRRWIEIENVQELPLRSEELPRNEPGDGSGERAHNIDDVTDPADRTAERKESMEDR